VWQSPEEFGDVIIRMGGFLLTCAYMGALGRGSIEQVLTGKHYNRALRMHKIVYKALERIGLELHESLHDDLVDQEGIASLDNLAKELCLDNLLASSK